MSSNLESNKIFAAVLIAGIVAMLSGFVAHKLVHPHDLEKDAVEIEGAALEGAGPAAVELPAPIMHLIATADIAQGEKLSKACAACHSFDQGGPNKVGPNLWNIVGGPVAGKAGFGYSDALIGAGGAWSYLHLNKFLWKPKKTHPGTKMNFIGLKKPEDRAAMIAWMRTLSSSQFPLPTDAEIAAENAELSPPEPEASAGDAGEEAPSEIEEPADAEDAAGTEPAAGQATDPVQDISSPKLPEGVVSEEDHGDAAAAIPDEPSSETLEDSQNILQKLN